MVDIENMNLDDEWIKEIDKDENIYKKFYKSAPNYVNLYITYLDSSNNIIHIKTQTTSLKFFAADLIKAGPPISIYSIKF